MRNIKLLAAILLIGGYAHAASDRFGNERPEVTRSSFTDTTNTNVVIASASADRGTFVVREVIFSGVNPTTVTFYDAIHFTNLVTTASRLEYSPGSTGQGFPSPALVNIYFSSGIMYNKQGPAPVHINWDYLAPGTWKGIRGDPRQ